MRTLICVTVLFAVSLIAQGQEIKNLDEFYSRAHAFFEKYVTDGRVDYAAIKKDQDELKELTNYMAQANMVYETQENKKAFYINAYNLTMIKAIVEEYPIDSPLDDPDIFTGEKHTIAHEKLTLEQIEKDKLLKATGDERLHFVLVCAANGCPPLASVAFKPGMLDQQMLTRAKVAMNSPYFIRVNDAEKKVELSQIFIWYAGDFESTGMKMLEYINKYRRQPIPADYKIGYYEYDWQLNDVKKK